MNPNPVTPPIPMIQDQEARLAKMRRRLEEVVTELDLAHDVVAICCEATLYQNADHDPEMDNVLRRCVTDSLFGQMKVLTRVIEQLGGTTKYSEKGNDDETDTERNVKINGEHKA